MVKDTIWGRKGMNKFFDLQNEYLTSNPINDPIYKTIFKTITFPIKVYKLIKANGENAQVSYVESLECWIIASKNVSLLAKSKDDLEIYTEDRFHFAKLIAQTWFDILEKSDNKEAI